MKKSVLKSFWADDRGQSTTEYILILSVVVMVSLKFRGAFQKALERIMGKVWRDLEVSVDGNGDAG